MYSLFTGTIKSYAFMDIRRISVFTFTDCIIGDMENKAIYKIHSTTSLIFIRNQITTLRSNAFYDIGEVILKCIEHYILYI